MTGIYVICFIVFPAAVVINAHKVHSANEFLDRQDANVVKGIATCFVILAHLMNYLQSNIGYNSFLNVFSVMGGMGVLLFFFVSGYGLYKNYRTKAIDITFWKKRLMNMYFPCIAMQLLFYLIETGIYQTFNIFDMIFNSLFGAWFVDVILVQYFIFFVSSKIAKGNSTVWIVLSFANSMMIALVFGLGGLNARWYNGLLLFPFGMLIAYKEEKIAALVERKWSLFLGASAMLFVVSGLIFTYFKGIIGGIDITKTFSGMCLSVLVCIVFLRFKFCSPIMLYMGKRSLYFYLVHINLLSIMQTIGKIKGIYVFYLVLISTFLIVEFFYCLHLGGRKVT